MKFSSNVPLLLVVAAVVSCGGETPPPAAPPGAAASAAPAPKDSTPQPATAPAPAPVAAEPPKPAPPSPVVKYTGLSAPESVLYDADSDRYIASNINGSPFAKDGNGFISVLSPEGQVTTLKWIEGGKHGAKLDGPKGLAIAKGVLYVADITVVRMFDLKTGSPKGEIAIAGSTFLNDLAAAPDGKVYVSDSGMKAGAGGSFEGTGTDAIYAIEGGHAKALAKGAELGRPNGLVWTDKGLVACTFGSDEIYRVSAKGAKEEVTKAPGGGLDGLISLGDSLLVTSWQASTIYRGKLGGTFEVALTDQKSPADIGYDTKRGRVLVPHLMEDTIEGYELK